MVSMQKQPIVTCKEYIDKLFEKHSLKKYEYLFLIENRNLCKEYLFKKARTIRDEVYGKKVFIRGLIEFSNICKNDCYYCGIRNSNSNAERYRLNKEDLQNKHSTNTKWKTDRTDGVCLGYFMGPDSFP